MMPAWIALLNSAQLSSAARPQKGLWLGGERRKNPISLSKEEREIEDRELSSRRNVKEIMRRKRLRHQFRRLLSRLMYCRGWANRIRIQVSASQLDLHYFLVSCSQRDDIHWRDLPSDIPSVGVKEGLSCVFSCAKWRGKARNLAFPWLQHSVQAA